MDDSHNLQKVIGGRFRRRKPNGKAYDIDGRMLLVKMIHICSIYENGRGQPGRENGLKIGHSITEEE
jgi:hypothetical protein